MPAEDTRRAFLKRSLCACLAGAAGCLDRDPDGAAPTSDPTESTATAAPTETAPEERTDDLYVENFDADEYGVVLHLAELGGTTETVVDAEYRIPGKTGLRVPNVGTQGNSYGISAAVGGETVEDAWEVRTCRGTEAPTGNRDAAVRIEDGEPSIVKNACDVVGVGMRSLDYVDHAELAVEATETPTEWRRRPLAVGEALSFDGTH